MTLHFKNYTKKIGTKEIRGSTYNWYKWRVFVDEDDDILQNIDYVEYQLHHTFVAPNRRVGKERRPSKFYLEGEGYGSFNINIIVGYEDGKIEEYQHFLDVSEKWP